MSDPRAKLYKGNRRCRACIDVVRVERLCYGIPDSRSRCAPCVKAGLRCSFVENPPTDSGGEEEEEPGLITGSRTNHTRGGGSWGQQHQIPAKLFSIACNLEGYASNLETALDTLKELRESQAELGGKEERAFAFKIVEKSLQKVVREMREEGKTIQTMGL